MFSNHRADYRAMINSARWVELRAQVLSTRPLCARCMHEGRETLATEVHHISPVEDGATAEDRRRLMFDATNLQPLCHSCHVATHVELGRGGKKGAVRRVEAERKAIDRLFTGEDDGTRIQRPATHVKKNKQGQTRYPPGGCFKKGVGVLLNPTHSLFSASDDFWNRWILTKQHQTQKDHPLQNLD